jgi:hypothetical protein
MSSTADDIVIAENARLILRHANRISERIKKLDDQAVGFGTSLPLNSALEDALDAVETLVSAVERVAFLSINAVSNADYKELTDAS